MLNEIIEKIKNILDSEITSYRLSKETGLSIQLIDKYRKGESKIENMTLEKVFIFVEYADRIEENTVMKQEQYLKLIKNALLSMDEEIRDNLYDAYFQPSDNHIWLMDSGMGYSGDDKKACLVAQIEGQEVVSWA